jgi:acid phosphatase family membrane protein YuiD
MIKIFLAMAISYFGAEGIKFILNSLKEKKLSFKEFFRDGGMPSAHTAFVTALLLGFYLETGLSYYTLIAFALFAIVINDALKVRRVTGEQSKAINEITKNKYSLDEQGGHTLPQVLVGFLIGIIITYAIMIFL